MALIDELKRRQQELRQEMNELVAHEEVIGNDLLDLDIAIAALEGPPVATLEQAPAQPVHPDAELRSVPGAEEESRDQSEGVRRFTEEVIRSETRDPGEVPAPEDTAEDFTLLDPALLSIDEPILDATILPQVTPDEVPPTAEVIHTDDGRKRFALFGGQTHEVVSGSGNPDADFWASVLHPKPKVDA